MSTHSPFETNKIGRFKVTDDVVYTHIANAPEGLFLSKYRANSDHSPKLAPILALTPFVITDSFLFEISRTLLSSPLPFAW